jgi:transposase-like protein
MLSIADLFKGRHFDREIIILCVRWYLRFKLSFRDLVEKMAERGISLAHTKIMRWIARYVPEFQKRWNRFACRVGASWRVDEILCEDQRHVDLSLPCCRQARKNGGFSAPRQARCCGG